LALLRLPLAAFLGAVLGAVALAGPASAHSADAPAATDYRVTVLGVSPPLPGLTVRAIEAGARLELVNHSSRTVEVLGYSGEPYLRIGPDGVYQNAASPATYLNETLAGGVAPPPTAGSAMPPQWTKLSATPAVLWHDHRTQLSVAAPPRPASSGGRRLLTWSVPLRDGVREFAVTGTLDLVPPPAQPAWWAGCLLLAAAVAALGLRGLRGPAAVSVAAGLAGLLYAAGAGLDSGALGPAGFVRVVLAQQTWPVVCGLAAVAAGGYAWLRRPAADLALGLAGACLAIFAGLGNAAVFAHAVTPSAWSGPVSRLLVLAAVAGGAGVAGGAVLLARRRARPVRVTSPTPSDMGEDRPVDNRGRGTGNG
jgi:hypothetical protein